MVFNAIDLARFENCSMNAGSSCGPYNVLAASYRWMSVRPSSSSHERVRVRVCAWIVSESNLLTRARNQERDNDNNVLYSSGVAM